MSVRIEGRPREEGFFCRSQNISATGVLIETDKQLTEGMRLECSFLIPGTRQVAHIPAKVIRVVEQTGPENERQYGLMFTDMPLEVRQMLADYGKKMSSET
jgi:hypothetical protein